MSVIIASAMRMKKKLLEMEFEEAKEMSASSRRPYMERSVPNELDIQVVGGDGACSPSEELCVLDAPKSCLFSQIDNLTVVDSVCLSFLDGGNLLQEDMECCFHLLRGLVLYVLYLCPVGAHREEYLVELLDYRRPDDPGRKGRVSKLAFCMDYVSSMFPDSPITREFERFLAFPKSVRLRAQKSLHFSLLEIDNGDGMQRRPVLTGERLAADPLYRHHYTYIGQEEDFLREMDRYLDRLERELWFRCFMSKFKQVGVEAVKWVGLLLMAVFVGYALFTSWRLMSSVSPSDPDSYPEGVQEEALREPVLDDADDFPRDIILMDHLNHFTFENGKEDNFLGIYNDTYCSYDLKVTIRRDSDNICMYESVVLRPGHVEAGAVLTDYFEPGDYECTVYYEYFNAKESYTASGRVMVTVR